MSPNRCLTASTPRRGIIAVLVAVCLTMIIAVAALSLDGGRLLDERRQVQAVADAAAMAAAIELFNNLAANNTTSIAAARASALSIAAANGYNSDGTESVVTINIPPLSGQFAGKAGYAEAVVQYNQRRAFSNIFGSGAIPVSARSVAAGTLETTKGSVLVLDPKKKRALFLSKGGSLLETDGDIFVNSKDKKAVSAQKGSQAVADNIIIVGGIEKKERGNLKGDVFTKAPVTANPLATLTPPAQGPNQKLDDYKTTSDGVETYDLHPGTYKGPLKFHNTDVVKMAPGIYYIAGGGISFKHNSSLQAQGVMIYNDDKKSITVDTRGKFTLTPPTTGTYAGISLFQNPDSKGKIQFAHDTQLDISGTIYAPNGQVVFRATDADISDDDAETDDAAEDTSDDGAADEGLAAQGSIGAQIIAKTLKLDKKSHVRIMGTGIAGKKPVLSVVE